MTSRKAQFGSRPTPPDVESTGNFHAVEILCGKDPCEAAKSLNGSRFLSSNSPLLPLPECDRRYGCQCRYRHHTDRRKAARRTADGGLPTNAQVDDVERRHAKGRRAEDTGLLPIPPAPAPTTPDLDDTYYDYLRRKD
jgi:hypothetical protein